MKKITLVLLLTFPVLIYAQEFGTNDFRISDAGGTGSATSAALRPSAVYNSINNEYLVVWQADDTDFSGCLDGEFEIIGQFIDANGAEIGLDFMISSHQGIGNASLDAYDPYIVYNSTDNQYLIVYTGSRIAGESEIYGVLLDDTGAVIKSFFRISDVGTDGNTDYDAGMQEVIYNSIDNEYLVVWTGDRLQNEHEVYGQRLDSNGNEIGVNDFQISTQGNGKDAYYPSIAWNSLNNEYLVVWEGDSLVSEMEVYGSRISNLGVTIGSPYRITNHGPTNNSSYDAHQPQIIYNPLDDRYLLTWNGDIMIGEDEIYGQQLNSAGGLYGGAFQISTQGPNNQIEWDAGLSGIAWVSATNSYFVSWMGDYDPNKDEVYLQQVSSSGALIGSNVKISVTGNPTDTNSDIYYPRITSNSNQGVLICWSSDYDTPPFAINENEIRIQMYGSSVLDISEYDKLQSETVIYPNPNNGKFTLNYEGTDTLTKLTVLDITGKTIQTLNFDSYNTNSLIDLKHLAKGMYFVKIQTNNAVATKRVIIK